MEPLKLSRIGDKSIRLPPAGTLSVGNGLVFLLYLGPELVNGGGKNTHPFAGNGFVGPFDDLALAAPVLYFDFQG